jgi:hypothetical protein
MTSRASSWRGSTDPANETTLRRESGTGRLGAGDPQGGFARSQSDWKRNETCRVDIQTPAAKQAALLYFPSGDLLPLSSFSCYGQSCLPGPVRRVVSLCNKGWPLSAQDK